MLDDEGKVSRELARVIGDDKLYDVQASDKLREFYKQLIQTDVQIKKLKQGFEKNNVLNKDFGYNMNVPERYKRSLKFIKPKQRTLRYNRNKYSKRHNTGDEVNNKNKRIRSKRYDMFDQPEGYLIEKKKVFIQYKPFGSKRQFPKCSHMLKDSKSHEKHLKHPFYQNSQRLDELLDHILDRNIHEIVRDPPTLDLLFSNKGKCNHKSEIKSNSFDIHEHRPNSIKSFSKEKETKTTKETSTFKTTEQSLHDNFKEALTSIKSPTIDTYIRNITLFDQAVENRNYEKLHHLETTEPNRAKNNYFNDPSFEFMAKIHSNNNLATSSKSHFRSMLNKISDNINPALNYDNLNSLYEHNSNHKIDSTIDYNKNMMVNKNDNLNMKGLPQDNLTEMMIDDTRTVKTFDMNLDYSDILLSSSPKMNILNSTNSASEEKEQDINLDHYTTDWRSKSNNIRKLLQIEEEDDDMLGYEDLKEVLADEMEAHDETDKRVDRKKRNENMPDVYNHNWKGPIPLYPDEINAIIKQAAIENIKIPISTEYITGIDKINNQISDTNYIEDYFDKKYDRLVKIAQAYSDYGVLESKKDSLNQNKDKTAAEKDINVNKLDISQSYNSGINARSKKGTAPQSEGIRFEIKPGKGDSVAKETDIMGTIQKHFKILKGNKSPHPKTTGKPYLHPDFSSLPNLSTLHYSLDKRHKFDSKTIEDPILAPKRGLKSVAYIDVDDMENGDEKKLGRDINDTVMDKHNGEEFKRNLNNESLKEEIRNYKNNSEVNTTMQVSDFFAMMSDWFSMLAKLSGETNVYEKSKLSTVTRDNTKSNKSVEVFYSSYDSDMVENIGHRSRILMSIADNNASLQGVDLKTKEEDKIDSKNKQFESTFQSNVDRVTTALSPKHINVTIEDTKNNPIKNLKQNSTIQNKTISKRSVETDSKLNFWNNIYDDEYGMKLDYFEKSRDKHSAKSGNLVKKSKNWFGVKVKNIANKLRSTKDIRKESVTENISTKSSAKLTISTTKPKIRKRRVRNVLSDDAEDTNDFAALTANMKKVVREAANAVKETRKLKVREDNKEETMASSLMQQLVRLMADVVDFQVQQKTCAKLPDDLQKFLEWLTSASDKDAPLLDFSSQAGNTENNNYNRYDNAWTYEKILSDDNVGLIMPENHLDDRTQSLGSIQAVQELMKQYDDMNDHDKSKMTGVKEYLENQLNFLNKKVSEMNEFNIYKYYKKRETSNYDLKKIRNPKLRKRRFKKRLNKFIKNYGKKHTKTTPGNVGRCN